MVNKYEEIKKELDVIGVQWVQDLHDMAEFQENLYNFTNLTQEEIEEIWALSHIVYEFDFVSRAYNFDTMSYALMGYVSEHGIDEELERIKAYASKGLVEKSAMLFVLDIINTYNDISYDYGYLDDEDILEGE